jgi:phosphoglycerate dehydrogenase-like enzyme
VIVEPPVFTVETVGKYLSATPSLALPTRGREIVVEEPPRPWGGDDVVGLLVWQAVTDADMGRLPGLRVIVTGSIGFDHIDVEAAKRRGIWVCNVPDYCVDEAADSTIALLTALLRGVVFLDRSVGDGKWDDHAAGPLPRIAEIQLGIVGFGQIGRAVATRARALGIETWATDPVVPAPAITAAGVRPAAFEELLRSVNALTLHLPLTGDSQHLISARELALMPRGSYLINTARGELVDLPALMGALETGQLAGAALDVLPAEPPPPVVIPRHPRLIVTPHAAWYSPTSERDVVRKATLSLRSVLDGQEPAGVVFQP